MWVWEKTGLSGKCLSHCHLWAVIVAVSDDVVTFQADLYAPFTQVAVAPCNSFTNVAHIVLYILNTGHATKARTVELHGITFDC